MPSEDQAGSHLCRRFFEDYRPGAIFDLGSLSSSEPEMIEFARSFDPQYIHIDPVAASAGPHGGIIASGWHTISMMMRLFVTEFLDRSNIGSPGVDEVRWMKPVRPGDTLKISVTVEEARVSKSKPDRGLVTSRVNVVNQAGEPVTSMKVVNLILRRPD